MDLHDGEQIIYEGHPSWRSVLGFYIKAVLAAAVAGVVVALITSVAAGVGCFVGVMAVMIVVGYLKRIGTTFIITNERLHIRRGLLSKSIQQTRLERVQNVNSDQSLLERILQVGTVDFDTAGTDDSDFVFDGVGDPDEVIAAVERAQRAGSTAGQAPRV